MEDKVMDTKGTSYNFAIIIAEIVEYDGRGESQSVYCMMMVMNIMRLSTTLTWLR